MTGALPRLCAACVLALAFAAGAAGNGAPRAATPAARAMAIVAATVERRDVPLELSASGTVTALALAEVRPQLASVIRDVHVHEGQRVAAADLLFTLDAAAPRAALARAQADLAKDQAALADAERQLARSRELAARRLAPQSELDAATATANGLRAQVQADRAAIQQAQVELAYTTIRAPGPGRIGTINWHPGSLVQPSVNPPLLTITQTAPIAVAFTVPERALPGLRAELAAGEVPVTARLEGGATVTGRLRFIDSRVDSASGTILMKAEFANADEALWPGQFVEVRVRARLDRDAAVVPIAAVQNGPEGSFVWRIGDDHKVAQQPVQLARIWQGLALVDGVEVGTRVVAEGGANLRPGSAITEVEPKP